MKRYDFFSYGGMIGLIVGTFIGYWYWGFNKSYNIQLTDNQIVKLSNELNSKIVKEVIEMRFMVTDKDGKEIIPNSLNLNNNIFYLKHTDKKK